MKKQFQTLSIAFFILLCSCGKHNAEISGTGTTRVKEFSTNNSSASDEPDLLLIGFKRRTRLKSDLPVQIKGYRNRPSARSSAYTIERNGETKTFFRSDGPYGVN